jgi:hypothetical protein
MPEVCLGRIQPVSVKYVKTPVVPFGYKFLVEKWVEI